MHKSVMSSIRALFFVVATVGAAGALSAADLTGTWTIVNHENWLERGKGPNIAEYQGLPINDSARQRALSWHSALINQPERQCIPLPIEYALTWSPFRIWKEIDPVTQELIAYRFHREFQEIARSIYMDKRPHPSSIAPHTYQGFSTGEWEGEKLKVTSTHLKEGYSRRNGVPRSDRATVIEHYMRMGNYMTISVIAEDPVYLTEPLIETVDYILSFTQQIDAYPCEVVLELTEVPEGYVPHYFPWKNPYVNEFSKKMGIPMKTVMGEAIQMYPDFLEGKGNRP